MHVALTNQEVGTGTSYSGVEPPVLDRTVPTNEVFLPARPRDASPTGDLLVARKSRAQRVGRVGL